MISEKSGGTVGNREIKRYISGEKPTITPHICHRGVASNGWVPEVEYYLCFTAILISSKISLPPIYSDYQQFLHDTIMEFREKGWTFNRIANWLNENRYRTSRGKRFFGNHVFSILKKNRLRDERLSSIPEDTFEIGSLSIQYVEHKLINSN